MMGGFAQIEREVLVERIRMGLQKRREEGKWSGSAPYGYRYDPERENLVINPQEAKGVKSIYMKYLELGTITSVTTHLNENGIKPRQSEAWRETSVAKILSNQIYLGKVKVSDAEWEDKSLRMIPDRRFQDCQTLRSSRRKFSPRLKVQPPTYDEGSFCVHCGRFCSEEMIYCLQCGTRVQIASY